MFVWKPGTPVVKPPRIFIGRFHVGFTSSYSFPSAVHVREIRHKLLEQDYRCCVRISFQLKYYVLIILLLNEISCQPHSSFICTRRSNRGTFLWSYHTKHSTLAISCSAFIRLKELILFLMFLLKRCNGKFWSPRIKLLSRRLVMPFYTLQLGWGWLILWFYTAMRILCRPCIQLVNTMR